MKTKRQHEDKIAEAHNGNTGTQGCSGLKKLTTKRRLTLKGAPGVLDKVLVQQFPSFSDTDTTKDVLAPKLNTGQVNPCTKMKLQLFPIDEGTRIRLEKDGHNPFLELTLRPRKKIISVLKHINTKWGSSSIASGEPMLYPYNKQFGNPVMGRKWTLKENGITAADVYTAVDSPAIFRLRYGWSSDHDPQIKTFAPFDCVGSESIQKHCITASGQTCDREKQNELRKDARLRVDPDVSGQTSMPVSVDLVVTETKIANVAEQSIAPWHDIATDLSIGGLLSEASLQGKAHDGELKCSNESSTILQSVPFIFENSNGCLLSDASLQTKVKENVSKLGVERAPFEWDDGLTALSIGGLLSEASLQGKNNDYDPMYRGRESGVHPEILTSDSFDSIVASQMKKYSQPEKPPPLDSHSSILDAEETCHAFSFQKFFSAGKDDCNSGRTDSDPSFSSFTFPKLHEMNKLAGDAEDTPFQESNIKLYNQDSSSLGLRGIKWNDSLGPFDFGISKLQQLSSMDSIGI